MKPKTLFKNITDNFDQIQYYGLVVEDEINHSFLEKGLDSDDYEGLIMRLYFLAIDPEKNINYFINQYEEDKYLYFFKVHDNVWLFIVSQNLSFAKLHFFIQYMLSDVQLDLTESATTTSIPVPEEENDKILSAKRIQQMLLPREEKLGKAFSEKYLWYQPKDIIGGDFYWAKDTREYEWIVVGDCTGHSIEGALASVSVMSILNQVFQPWMNPHHLIKELHRGLNDMQNQDLDNGYGIGCELMVLKYEKKTRKLMYSGTGMTMNLVTNGSIKVFKTKKATFDPDTVIKYIRYRTLKLNPGDGIFTYSDGITDQLDDSGKRIKNSGLIKYLRNEMSFDDTSLKDFFRNHKKNQKQTDDLVYLFLRA